MQSNLRISLTATRAEESMQKRKQKDRKSQRWWMPSRKQHLSDTVGRIYIWKNRNCGGTQDRHRFKTNGGLSTDMWEWKLSHLLGNKLFAFDSCLLKKKSVQYNLVYLPNSRTGLLCQSSWLGQSKLCVCVCCREGSLFYLVHVWMQTVNILSVSEANLWIFLNLTNNRILDMTPFPPTVFVWVLPAC